MNRRLRISSVLSSLTYTPRAPTTRLRPSPNAMWYTSAADRLLLSASRKTIRRQSFSRNSDDHILMWAARTKNDLIIEVWEKLDCESVGAAEVEAIEIVLNEQFGPGAVDSPMEIARAVADEGADLRHSELMELWLARATDRP